MGLFSRKPKKIYPKGTYRIFMNESGKPHDPIAQTMEVTDDNEFLAILVAEKKYYPHFKVAKVEKIGEGTEQRFIISQDKFRQGVEMKAAKAAQ